MPFYLLLILNLFVHFVCHSGFNKKTIANSVNLAVIYEALWLLEIAISLC